MYNEEARVREGLRRLDQLRALLPIPLEAILVDDGSQDGTLRRSRRLVGDHTLLLSMPHRGKGAAVKAGVARAGGDRILFTDIDWSVAPQQIPILLEQSGDVVLATREGPGAHRLGEPAWRHLVGRAFNLVVQQGIIDGHADTQCGCKLFTSRAAHDLFPRLTLDGWAFDVELLLLAHRRGYTVNEVPVVWSYQSSTRLRLLGDSISMFRELLKIRTQLRSGTYDDP